MANQPSRRTLTIEHDGDELYVEVLGEGGVPMVFCHGLGGNHAVWLHQAPYFARDREVVLWDHRGFGRSTDRGDRSNPELAATDLLAVCDHLQISQADLVGQSMGGWTIVGAALARPSLARRMVLADSLGGFVSNEITAAIEAAVSAVPELPDQIGAHPAIDPSLAERNPAMALLYQQLGGMSSIDPPTMMRRIVGTTHDAADAAQLTCPVLCVVGDRDRLFSVASVRAMADQLPNSRVVEIQGAGHSPYFEDPDAWNAAVYDFLDGS